MTMFYEKLLAVSEESHVKTEEKMGKHTTFRVGGPAAYYVSPKSEQELADIIRLCRREAVSYCVLGNGSNLLVGDGGFDGVIVSMTGGFSYCRTDRDSHTVTAGAGASLSRVGRAALDGELAGFEFAAGIPGTVGGAVVMNAGAYGSEMKDVITSVRVMTAEGEVKVLSLSELKLGYRTSCIPENHYIVLETEYLLKPGKKEEIKAYMDDLAERRKSRQPLEYPSAGSTFKRPEGNFAGRLIEEAGLSGYQVGGAAVSDKHCGFVINKDHATALDIITLCREVETRVYEQSGVKLEMEVKTLGKFESVKET